MGILNKPTLADRVMRRVYFAWGIKRGVRNAAKLVILFTLAFVAREDIWYAQVLQNLKGVEMTVSGVVRYAASAFSGTETIVQLAAVLGLFVGAAMLWDIGRTVRRLFTIAAEKRASRVLA